jgi:hypothetical protein
LLLSTTKFTETVDLSIAEIAVALCRLEEKWSVASSQEAENGSHASLFVSLIGLSF